MPKAPSVDLRQRVADAVQAGSSGRAAAARFGVDVSSAIRWVVRARARGDLTRDKRGGNVRSRRIDEHREFVLALIAVEPGLALAEVAERVDAATGYRPLPSIDGHWNARIFVGALRLSGITAPMTLGGAMNGAAFLTTSGTPFATPSTPSHPMAADSASQPPAIIRIDRNSL